MPMDLQRGGMKPIVYKEGWLWVVRKGSLDRLARPRRNASVGVVATGHLAGIDAGVRPI
jgi:hypothetical protein